MEVRSAASRRPPNTIASSPGQNPSGSAPTVVVHPCDESSLRGAVEAAELGIITPILVGPADKITKVAREHRLNIDKFEVVDVPHSDAAAAKGVELIREGAGELLMKGSLHTDELMREVTSSKTGLRTERRISHVFVMDVPTYPDTIFITDAAINIFPDLDAKRDVVQNAIDLWTQTGLGTPRVAILSAVETVTTKIPSTIDAAALCKMADRGQITGGVLDGPLAFDNVVDPEAVKIKGIKSEVAGRAQILVVPDLEAGNMLAKNLTFLARADAAGIVLGHASRSFSHRAQTPSGPGLRLVLSPSSMPPRDAKKRPFRRPDTMDTILVVNAGSSSLKFQLFGITAAQELQRLIKGQVDGIGTRPRLRAEAADGVSLIDKSYAAQEIPHAPAAISITGDWLRETQRVSLVAVGHRVVHGGPQYDQPTVVDQNVLASLERYVSLAPLHKPHNLAPIRLLLERRPDVVQVACFDTAFHRGHAPVADRYAIPEHLYQEGVRRYGFHGLSYEYVAGRLPDIAPDIAKRRVIVAHLGSSASMCALFEGKSVESTMGFTALDGLPMGTRPGQIDPGVCST